MPKSYEGLQNEPTAQREVYLIITSMITGINGTTYFVLSHIVYVAGGHESLKYRIPQNEAFRLIRILIRIYD